MFWVYRIEPTGHAIMARYAESCSDASEGCFETADLMPTIPVEFTYEIQ